MASHTDQPFVQKSNIEFNTKNDGESKYSKMKRMAL